MDQIGTEAGSNEQSRTVQAAFTTVVRVHIRFSVNA